MANNPKKYASDSTLSSLVAKIKELFVKKTDLNTELAKKADSSHTHSISDTTSLQSALDGKVPTSRTINSKPLSANITLSASDVGAAPATHDHNSVYYTQSQVDTKLSGKSDSTHNHDAKYDTKGSASAVQENLDTISDTLDAHTTNSDIHFTAAERTKLSGITAGAQVNTVTGVKGNSESTYRTGNINITKANIGLGNVDNTADADKSVNYATSAGSATSATKATQDGNGKVISSTYETKSDASAKLTEAKTYADNAANTVKNDLLNNAGAAYDTLKELGDLIDDNKDAIDALNDIAAGKANATHTHAISDVTNLQSTLDGKANSSHGTHVTYSTTAPVMDGTASVGTASTVARSDHKHPTDTSRASKTEFDSHNSDTTKHITTTERTNWNAAKTHADSAHAPSNAQPNQNAFSNIKVGSTTIAADTTTDTLTLAGTNVTITPDATNDKVTIAVADATTSTKGVVQLTDSVTSTSTTTAATPKNVKAAYDLANTAKTTADGKANASHTHTVANITDLTATATELNYMDGVTSNVQAQIDGKAASSHNHSASNITSGILSSDRLPTVPIAKGGTGATTAAAALTNLGITATATEINKLDGVTATTAELNYVDGVTSNIQTQLNAKASSSHTHGTDYVSTSSQTLNDTQKMNARNNIGAAKSDHTHSTYATKANPVFTGSISMQRDTDGTTGNLSTALGYYNEASGSYSFAVGSDNVASGYASVAIGASNTASADGTFAGGISCTASADESFAFGKSLEAASDYQFVTGKNNVVDTEGKYVHIVGNGLGNGTYAKRNAHTLDWDGNAWFKGNIYTGGTSQNSGATMLASVSTVTAAEYTALEEAEATNANTLYMITDAEEETPTQVQIITWEEND